MKFRIRYAEQITGIFILVAIIMGSAVLIFMGINQRWFEHDPAFFSKFKSAGAVKVGASITFKGFQIGQVDSLKLLDDNTVEVWFKIFNRYYSKVKENSVLQSTSNPLGIGGGLLFHPGKNDKDPLPEGSFIPSLDFSLGQEIVRKGLVETIETDQLGEYITSISEILSQIEDISRKVGQETLPAINGALAGKDTGPIGAALANVEVVTEEALAMIRDLSLKTASITSDIESVSGETQGTIRDLSSKTASILSNIRDVSANLQDVSSNLRDVSSNLRELSSNLNKNLSDSAATIKSFITEDGSVARILDDKGILFKRINDILAGINSTLSEINAFTGYLNESTPELAGILEKSRKALSEGKDVLEGLKNNPLIRGGIPERKEQPTTFQSYRDEDF